MPLDPQTTNNLITAAVAIGAAFISALWLSLVFWTYRDMQSRRHDSLLAILAAIIVALLFLPGLVIYLILRPRHTLDEEFQRTLEEEAMLQAIEDNVECPGCGRHINENWIVCPSCHTKLRKPCPQCHQLMELSWNLCPYCGTPSPGKKRDEQILDRIPLPTPVEELNLPPESSPPGDVKPVK